MCHSQLSIERSIDPNIYYSGSDRGGEHFAPSIVGSSTRVAYDNIVFVITYSPTTNKATIFSIMVLENRALCAVRRVSRRGPEFWNERTLNEGIMDYESKIRECGVEASTPSGFSKEKTHRGSGFSPFSCSRLLSLVFSRGSRW